MSVCVGCMIVNNGKIGTCGHNWAVPYKCIREYVSLFFYFQAEDGIRDLVRSRGLGDVYKRQVKHL